MVYNAAEFSLTKMGDARAAWVAAERGVSASDRSEDPAIQLTLRRALVHALQSNDDYAAAVRLAQALTEEAFSQRGAMDPRFASALGTLQLAGSMAAARQSDARAVRQFMNGATALLELVRTDSNFLYTSFGPTNVALHDVSTQVELGNSTFAVERAPRIDASHLPMERRVRAGLVHARALVLTGDSRAGSELLLMTERLSPRLVASHFATRNLLGLLLGARQSSPLHPAVVDLARRAGVA